MEVATKETALKRITELVELFDEHYELIELSNKKKILNSPPFTMVT